MTKYMQSRFRPQNPQKYKGNPTNIIYRSSWELVCMRKFDMNPNIIEWQSEELAVPYRSPLDGKIHRYFPDFIIKKKNKDGSISTAMVEVKPLSKTKPPKKPNKPGRGYLAEMARYAVNEAKWEAAQNYCRKKGWEFIVITEKEIF